MKAKVIPLKGRKKENYKQRAYLNSLTSMLDYAGNQITGFVVSPFIVNGLGNSMYGIYQMLNQMTGYANMADTKASQVLKSTVAQKRESASRDELRSELTTALVVTSLILPLVLLAGSVLVWYAPIISQAEERYFNLIRVAASLMVVSLVIYKVFELFESLLRGMNLGFKGMGVRTAIIVLAGVLKVVAITGGYGLVGLGVVQVIIGFITGATFYVIVKRNVDWFGFGKTNRAKIMSYSKVSGWFMGFSFTQMALLSSDKIILGYLIGPEFVTVYVLTMFIVKAMEGVIKSVASGIIPGVGKFFGNKEFDKVKDARRILLTVIWPAVAMLGVTVIMYNESFLSLWVGEGKYAGSMENLLILAIGIQSIFFYLDSTFINVTLDLKIKVYLAAMSSIITIALAFVLVEQYQITGMCVSILIGRLILTIGYPIILKNKMNEGVSFFTMDNIRPLFIAFFMFLLAYHIGNRIRIDDWLNLIGMGIVTALGVGFLFYYIGLSREARKEIFGIASKIKFLGLKNIEK